MIFLLLDIRRTPGEQDMQMHEWARDLESVDERIVLTKADKLSNNQLLASRRGIASELEVDDAQLIAASVVSKKGIDEIRREMIARM
jgi:GTP-binding protein EngB required for normal cell division